MYKIQGSFQFLARLPDIYKALYLSRCCPCMLVVTSGIFLLEQNKDGQTHAAEKCSSLSEEVFDQDDVFLPYLLYISFWYTDSMIFSLWYCVFFELVGHIKKNWPHHLGLCNNLLQQLDEFQCLRMSLFIFIEKKEQGLNS